MKTTNTICLSLLTLCSLSALNADAFVDPGNRLPNIDSRTQTTAQDSLVATNEMEVAYASAQTAAIASLETCIKDVRVSCDPITGAPRLISAQGGFLTESAGQGSAISADALEAFSLDDPNRIIYAFINEHESLFGHTSEHLEEAELKSDSVNSRNGLRTVIWQQHVDEIPVFQGLFIAHLTKHEELVSIKSHFIPNPATAADAVVADRASLVSTPPISADEAVALAANNIHFPISENGAQIQTPNSLHPEHVVQVDNPTGATKQQRFTAPDLSGESIADLVWLPMNRAILRLCWQVILTSTQRGEMFRVLVDAQTGDVLIRHGLTEYLSDATYRVFTSDSPSPFSPGHTSPNSSQPSLVSRSLVVIDALSATGSPDGWIDDSDNQTLGNNVDAHLDLDDNNIADPGSRPTGSPSRVFDFSMNLNLQPSTYQDASVVQLFYWNNWTHDRLYDLGFTESGRNFQTDNFGRGGIGNDAVQADGQDGGGTNNANFSTPPDGSPGRMQMYIFDGPTPARDGDLDAEIIIHEYCHGLSNRRVGGGVGMSALQSRSMGEGWSDFYPLALLSEAADNMNGNYATGGYLTYEFYGLTENYYYGIRRYPYSTDMTKNPLTFKDIDPTQASSHTGIPKSSLPSSYAAEVHNAGEVWCVTLWDARANLITKYGFAIGNELILQLVTDGMELTPANPTFIEARDAILQADLVNNAGANQSELWTAFAKRGMGFIASAPDSGTTIGVIESFDMPDDLRITPKTGFSSSGNELGPFAPDSAPYQVRNAGTSALPWTVTTSAAWLNLSKSGGVLPAGTTDSLTVSLNAAANSLPPGIYSSSLVFENTASSYTQIRNVELRVETYALLPFSEGFESGTLATYWESTGTEEYRTQITSDYNPYSGTYHLVMDDLNHGGAYSRNELTLGINLAYSGNVMLSFWARDFNDEPNGPPAIPFTGGADFDGVAISEDGILWYEVQALRDEISSTNTLFTVDLDAAAATHSLTFNSTFRIRFNHYDNFSMTTDGIAIDNITITGILPDTDGDGMPDAWERAYFSHPSNCVATLDADRDGLSNLGEYIAGTDPTNAVSVFSVTYFERMDDEYVIEWNPLPGRTYSPCWATSLIYGDFLPMASNLPYTVNCYTDTVHGTENSCFYNVEVQLE